jgi:hypothetical protein
MSGRRRVQRSVRLTLASGLLAAAGLIVVPAVVTGTGASVAAVVALLAGAISCRIVYTEVVQTRAQAARDRAEQARAFEATLTKNLAEHADFTALMSRRVQERDRAITELHGTIRLAERRADDAETRVLRESRRANDAQRRLAVLLDEVAAHQAALEAEGAATEQLSDLPTIVDLLAWEEKVTATTSAQADGLRQEA